MRRFSRFLFGSFLLLCVFQTACSLFQAANSTPLPPLVTAVLPSAEESLTAVSHLTIPPRDVVTLAAQLKGIDAPRVAQTTATPYVVGDVAPFWVKNLAENKVEQVQAVLLYRSDALNLWVQNGERVTTAQLEEAAGVLEDHILPTNRAFFGMEWQPGVDGDHRLNVLHVADLSGIGVAYFASSDEVVTAVNPYSNQRELLTLSLNDLPLGSERYYQTLAHELQHLIHWHTDSNEEAWLNEGLAELAAHLNGYATGREMTYVQQTDIQLNNLSQEPGVVGAHYAAAFLFATYFLDRFGEEATQRLVQQPENGLGGVAATLETLQTGVTVETLFADWLAANYLQGVGQGSGVWQYQTVTLPAIEPMEIGRFAAPTAVNQFGADYLAIDRNEPVTLVFTGTQQVQLVDTLPHSGNYFYYSYPADESAVSMTRAFDLTTLTEATLTFWAWYDIEAGWDYGYVAVSADGGERWTLLQTNTSTLDNPQGNSFGPGFTGRSEGWVSQTADLTPYAGQSILLRFWYITDSAIHQQGFVIDDIAIPQLGYEDGGEGDTGWVFAGFVRTGPVLPQKFMVQRIDIGPDGVRVEQLPLQNNQGQWQFPMDKSVEQTILIVSGMTPVTAQTAVYQIEIR